MPRSNKVLQSNSHISMKSSDRQLNSFLSKEVNLFPETINSKVDKLIRISNSTTRDKVLEIVAPKTLKINLEVPTIRKTILPIKMAVKTGS